MIRFIDCTKAYWSDPDETLPVFTFLDTVTDKFVEFNDSQVWSDWGRFCDDVASDPSMSPGMYLETLDRYMKLVPKELMDVIK